MGLEAWGGPVVNTTSTLEDLRFPLVEVDHEEIGRMAGHHFAERGYTSFAFFGNSQAGFSRQRENGYRSVVEELGQTVRICHADHSLIRSKPESWIRDEEEVEGAGCSSSPRPSAIFVSHDLSARMVINACRQLNLRVPEDLAILSVDNDEFECMLSTPTLSSIEIPAPGSDVRRPAPCVG